MSRYYFVLAALPPLTLGSKPEMSFKEFQELLELNLTEKDLKKVDSLLEPIDIYNVKALWLGLPLDEKGTMVPKDLEEALLVRDSLPRYIIDFLERYEATSDRLAHFSSLYVSFYQQKWSGFLEKYFHFEREIRLIFTALRAKALQRDLVKELQFEDPFDPFVAQILSQKDMGEYIPPREYENLKTLFVENSSEPEKLALVLLKYRFEKIEEMEENEHFTIDQILGYTARLLIVENWHQLDHEKGKLAVEELSRYG